MLSRLRSHAVFFFFALALLCVPATTRAQTTSDDEAAGDDSVQIFQQAQDAHEAGDLERALQLYDQALKLRAEFPEAEYQRANALVAMNRLPEAEKGFRRASELQPEWSLPYLSLGNLLARLERYEEAEKLLRRSLELDANNFVALVTLADLHLRTKAPREKLQSLLEDLKRVTARETAKASLWAARGSIERALGDLTAALASLDRALLIDRQNVAALAERAELRASANNYEGALADALAAQRASNSSPAMSLLLARIYARAGRSDEALKTLDALGEEGKRLPEAVSLRTSLTKDCGQLKAEERAAEEERLKTGPGNATLLACLGAAYRTAEPARALDFYRRAAEIEPRNVGYATGYAAALVQARRFAEAAIILRRVLAVEPENFAAHTNLATALYELKQFPSAVAEFQWLLEKKPDLAVAYYFIATAHDFLGEYPEALAAYESFLSRADAQTNQLEIDKVNLRLPLLRNQVKRGEGVKKRKT